MFVCNNCGFDSKKWLGKCPECQNWDCFSEFKEAKVKQSVFSRENIAKTSLLIDFTNDTQPEKIRTNIQEFDRCLSGGLAPSSVILISGEPGIGKSTLLLQVANELIKQGKSVLYASGEESGSQIANRGVRLKVDLGKIAFLNTTCIEDIKEVCDKKKPDAIILDSIQTSYSTTIEQQPSSITQVRTSATLITNYAKQNNIIVIIIGHINKDGQVAGPKMLEHIVDTIISFEESTQLNTRIIKCTKNRFGNINEIGIFQMLESGLSSVSNPSEFFIDKSTPSKILFATGSTNRSMLFEIESLVTKTYSPIPRRVVIGWDQNRLAMMTALLSKCGLKFFENDIYCSIASGFKTDETTADLSFCIAIIKSYLNLKLPDILAIGEISLSGQIKATTKIKERIQEGIRFGIKHFIVPNIKEIDFKEVNIIKISNIKNIADELKKISQQV